MANDIDAIPPNADKLLFAEDLLSFVVHSHNGIFYPTWRAGPYREFIYNGFNENIKKAVEFLYESLEWEIDMEFANLFENNNVNKLSLTMYARNYEILYFNEGFEPEFFLTYCVRVAIMAAHFMKYDVPEALDIALSSMFKVFQDYDMFQGCWETLNIISLKHVKTSKDFHNLLTPDVSDDDLTSDSSDEDSDDIEEDVESNDNHEAEERSPLIVHQEEEILNRLQNEELNHGIAEHNLNPSYSESDSGVESQGIMKPSEEDTLRVTNASSPDETFKGNQSTTTSSSAEAMHVPEASKLNAISCVQYEIQIIQVLNGPSCQENMDCGNT